MKFRKIVSSLLIAGMLISAIPFAGTAVFSEEKKMQFDDVAYTAVNWFYDDVKAVFDAGLMDGKSERIFAPNEQLTRAQAVTVLARMNGIGKNNGSHAPTGFSDADAEAWYAGYIRWAKNNNVSDGYPEGTFRPDDFVSREELATLLARYIRENKIALEDDPLTGEFADKEEIGDWAKDDVDYIRTKGLIDGKGEGKFAPKDTATRAEMARILNRIMTNQPDPVQKALSDIEALQCEEHDGVIHITTNTHRLSSVRIAQVLAEEIGLNQEKYSIELYTQLSYDINAHEKDDYVPQESFCLDELWYDRLSIIDNETGEVLSKINDVIIALYRVNSLGDRYYVGQCPEEIGDPVMEDVWDNMEDLYVFNADGKICIPRSASGSKKDFSQYFTEVLLGVYDDIRVGYHNSVYKLNISDDEFAKVSALRSEGGECTVTATLENTYIDLESEPRELELVVMTNDMSRQLTRDIQSDMSEKLIELRSLMAQCEELGIPTDYETVAVQVIELFVDQYLDDYISKSDFERLTYVELTLGELYDKAKTDLEGYLSGEKEPKNVPRYVTSDNMEIDGYTLLAQTVDSYGNEKKRPVYFYGWGDGYAMNTHEMPNYSDLGVNAYEYMELYMFDIIRTPNSVDEKGISKDGHYVVDTGLLEKHLKVFEEAEQNNIAITLVIIRGGGRLQKTVVDSYNDPTLYHETDDTISFLNINLEHEKTKEMVEAYLRAVVPMVAEYKSLNNIVLANEPGLKPASYGDTYLPKWREFLAERYESVDKLNEVYSSSYASFEEVPIPVREDLFDDNAYAYDGMSFAAKVHSDFHRWEAGIVKELAPNIPISTKIQNNESDRGMKQTGTRHEYWSDFQELGGIDYGADSALAYDHVAGAYDAPVVDSEVHILRDSGYLTFTPATDRYMDRVIWRGFIHHMGVGTIWSWDYWPDTGNYKKSNYTSRPKTLYNVGAVTLDLNRLSYEINAIETTEADIALLYSYPSRQYMGGRGSDSINDVYTACLYSGEQVRIVSEEQIEKINKCKVLIIPESENVSENTLKAIYQFAENGGKIIMVGRDSLKKDDFNQEHTSDLPRIIKELSTVIDVQPNVNAYKAVFEKYLDKNDFQNVWLIDAETGETVKNSTEWQSAEYNGHTVVTAYSMGITKPMSVKLIINGEVVTSSRELRSGDMYGETFMLYPDTPILLQADAAAPSINLEKPQTQTSGDYTYKVDDGKATIVSYSGNGGEVTIPAVLNGMPVGGIGAYAFSGNDKLTSVTLENGITSVGNGAFSNCSSLKNVSIPDSVTDIGECAFYFDAVLENVTLGKAKSIGERAFEKCYSLKNVSLPSTVTVIGEYAFTDCDGLEAVSVPDSVEAIGDYAFLRCSSLQSFTFPTSLTKLGVAAFRDCSNLSGEINIPYGITDIEYYAFANCKSITNVKLANSVLQIDENAFYNCKSLEDVELPNSLLYIGRRAFEGTKLTSIYLPDSVMHLGDGFSNAKEIYVGYKCMTGKNSYNSNTWYFEEGSIAQQLIDSGVFSGKYEILNREEHHIHTPGPEATAVTHQTCTKCGAVLARAH
ncbi:MAG: leucine-rich repeat protein [Clostridiales bacterium]|nr:leucine-rich repeat protein [Clostridiales bacterium]